MFLGHVAECSANSEVSENFDTATTAARRSPPVAHAGPRVAETWTAALAAVSRCAEQARQAGCRAASTYVDGAGGNLRRALAELAHRYPHVSRDDPEFDVDRHGASEVLSVSGFADTIVNCRTPNGEAATVRALVPVRDPLAGIWLRPEAGPPGLHVRGRVDREDDGYVFHDDPELEASPGIGDGAVPVGRAGRRSG